MKIYSNANWPVIQSRREQKFRSGLLAASAEFIAPANYSGIPTTILSSIGDLDIYPPPTISTDTSGFKKISATGYGVWNSGISEESININVSSFTAFCNVNDGAGNLTPYSTTKSVMIESGWSKKIGSTVPTLSRSLAIINDQNYTVGTFFPWINATGYSGNFNPKSISKINKLSSVKQNKYGNIIESEATYELVLEILDFGIFTVKI